MGFYVVYGVVRCGIMVIFFGFFYLFGVVVVLNGC